MVRGRYDYRELGFKAGLEIHQELDLQTKLFCKCPTELQRGEPDYLIKRYFRPVMGEMGEFDKAMLIEYEKNRTVIYEGHYQSNCTYELDETPPSHINEEAVDIGIMLTLLLNGMVVDEIHVCRKNYLDGSVTCGFQRTLIVGIKGYLPLSDKKVYISTISVEEDAARKISAEDQTVVYRLDRLGIPLIEVATEPVLETPDEIREAAYRLGLLLRATGKSKRGIGTVRQDINLSVKGGSRVELKGVQKLEWIPRLVDGEIERQLNLIEIKDELLKRKSLLKDLKNMPLDLSSILSNTECKLVSSSLRKGKSVLGVRLPGFSGIMGKKIQLDKSFGSEVAERVNAITGLKGIIHSDEDFSKYGFNQDEWSTIKSMLNVDANDAFVLVVGEYDKAKRAVEIVVERCRVAYHGVPLETRRALEDGKSRFEREIHGGARLYPDTDTPPMVVSEQRIKRVKDNMPEYPWETEKNYSQKYGLPTATVRNLILEDKLDLFMRIVDELSVEPVLVATTLIESLKSLQRENPKFKEIREDKLYALFSAVKAASIAKEAIGEVLRIFGSDPDITLEEALGKLGLTRMSPEELEQMLDKLINENLAFIREKKERAFAPLMGEAMKKARGKIDGKLVSDKLKEKLSELVVK